MPNYILGIDGGGTRCRAAVAAADGRILGRGEGGAANILTDPDDALANIVDAARGAFANAGLSLSGMTAASAVLGLAGSNVGDAARYVKQNLPFAEADIESDVLIALEGAVPNGDGAVASLGTGTVYVMRKAGAVSSIGGWGFIIGDLGSGARIGQALLQESLLAADGIHASSPLTEAVMADFGNDPRKVVEFARQARPGAFGGFAPRVFHAAERGDAVAASILQDATNAVNEALDAVVARGASRLCLLGGLAPLYRPRLAERHQRLFVPARSDALTGAVLLAARRFAASAEGQA